MTKEDFKNEYSSYTIDQDGNVWSDDIQKYVVPSRLNNGYLVVHLRPDDSMKYHTFLLHKLVMILFGPAKPSIQHWVRFNDNNRSNCSIDNLRWVQHSRSHREDSKMKMRIKQLERCQERQDCSVCGKSFSRNGMGARHLNHPELCKNKQKPMYLLLVPKDGEPAIVQRTPEAVSTHLQSIGKDVHHPFSCTVHYTLESATEHLLDIKKEKEDNDSTSVPSQPSAGEPDGSSTLNRDVHEVVEDDPSEL